MVLNVSSLLKTVKAVEDEHTRGTRAMESTVEAIAQEIRVSFIFKLKFYFFKFIYFYFIYVPFRPCIHHHLPAVIMLHLKI